MNTIMLPLDGSELAQTALQPALRLAVRHDAALVLATVVSDLPPVPLASGSGEALSHWFADEERRAARYLETVRDDVEAKHPGLEVRTRVARGPVAETLIEQAETERADLLVLTTHGRGAWQRAWLGSVADALVRRAMRPLLMLREGDESAMLFADEASPGHVVVPLDGSAAAEEILGPLTSVLPARGGRVTLLSVVRRPSPMASSYIPHAIEGEAVSREQQERVETHLREAAARWDPLGVQVGTRVVVADDVARAILDHAAEARADLVALSTRGRGGVGRFILGSVADKLVRGSELPVLAVRRAQDRDG